MSGYPQNDAVSFGFAINPSDIHESRAAAAEGEALGFSRVGVWDSPSRHREVWVTLAALALSTERISIGTWVTNGQTRHPLVTASALATLEELAPGRVILGIGTGDSGVVNLGGKVSKLEFLREYVGAVTSLVQTGKATWADAELELQWAPKRPIPVFISAHGPRALELAGEIADGVIVASGVTPEAIAESRATIARGAEKSGRDIDDLDLWYMAPWYVNADPDAARRDALWHLASLVHHWSRTKGGVAMFPESMQEGIRQLGQTYDMRSHGSPSEEQKSKYATAATGLGVADYLVSRFTLTGTPVQVAHQVQQAVNAGARNFDCANAAPAGKVMDRPRTWHAEVMPLLAD